VLVIDAKSSGDRIFGNHNLRHSNLHVTNKYLQATSKTKRLAHDKLIDAFLPAGLLPRPNLLQQALLRCEFHCWNQRLVLIVP